MMPAKIREIQFLWIWPLQSILSSPAAANASLKPQITRGLNKPGVFRDLGFWLMQKDGFTWDAWCYSCHQLTTASVDYECTAATPFSELLQCMYSFSKWDHFCFCFVLKFSPVNFCGSGADSQATLVSLRQDCQTSWGGVGVGVVLHYVGLLGSLNDSVLANRARSQVTGHTWRLIKVT